jgi:isopentenyldiphosphate isomerase
MEYVDIITPDDRVLRTVSRVQAHKECALHRAIHVIIETADGCVLLQQRSATKSRYPLWWHGAVAGHVSAGETPLQAAYKETREELGVYMPLHYIGACMVRDRDEHEKVYVYEGMSEGPFSPDPEEVAHITFVHASFLPRLSHYCRLTPHAHRSFAMWSAHRGYQ